MERSTERNRRGAGVRDAPPRDVGRALRALSNADLARLKALARLWSRGLPGGVGWADVLNEAIMRALNGSRPWPDGVPLLAFLSGVMRSLCDEHWRRARRESVRMVHQDPVAGAGAWGETAAASDPERVLAAAQALAAINRLFADDPAALKIITGLAEGMTAREICGLYGMSEREYGSARKRMRRALLRGGLSWSAR